MMPDTGSPLGPDAGNCILLLSLCPGAPEQLRRHRKGVCSFGCPSMGSSTTTGQWVLQHPLLVMVTSGDIHPATSLPHCLTSRTDVYESTIKLVYDCATENTAV